MAQNSVRQKAPTYDPMFLATTLNNDTGTAYYTHDTSTTTVACAEQYRICNPRNNTRGGQALRATDTLFNLDQAPLPNNQWHIETSSWFNAGLAQLQAKIQEYATGPSNIVPGSYNWQPNDPVSKAMCYSQLINDTTSMSFSVLGMGILFGLGGLIICLAMCIDTIVGWIQMKTGRGLHGRMEWLMNDRLQMQRLLYVAIGLGAWRDDPSAKIPMVIGREKFPGVAEQYLSGVGRHDTVLDDKDHDGADAQLVQEVGGLKHDDNTAYRGGLGRVQVVDLH
ncbi:hypothetical protein LTR66_016325 [Elasticomyces elasticus]|nr:hypothetical protein LTR66_016325 [Elasticomyces elasticus]